MTKSTPLRRANSGNNDIYRPLTATNLPVSFFTFLAKPKSSSTETPEVLINIKSGFSFIIRCKTRDESNPRAGESIMLTS